MRSKTRTTIITLIAASSLAFAAGPLTTVASAQKNTGKYDRSNEGTKRKISSGSCQKLQTSFNEYIQSAERFADDPNLTEDERQKFFDKAIGIRPGSR